MTEEKATELINALTPLLLFIFSWVLMLPIGVIISGIFLGSLLQIATPDDTRFTIPLYILRIEARTGQVVAGFYAYLLTFVLVVIFGGAALYEFIKRESGLDPGHFNALCVTSSILSALWTSIPFVLATYLLKPRTIAASTHLDVLQRITDASKQG
jgi:hypothetical protein